MFYTRTMDPNSLQSILRTISLGKPSYPEMLKIVHYSRSIAESYLLHHRASVLRLCEINGISLADLATDIIAEIFEKNKENRFVQIDKFLDHLATPFNNIDVKILQNEFQRYVVLRARVQLARTYIQTDSAGAKILRNLKIHLQKSNVLHAVEDFRGYVIEPRNGENQKLLPAFQLEVFEQLLLSEIRNKADIPEILDSLAGVLCRQTTYRRSILLFDVVQIIKKVYLVLPEEDIAINHIELSSGEIEYLQSKIHRDIEEKIITKYWIKGKLDKKQSKILSETFKEIMTQWWSGDGNDTSIAKITRKNFDISTDEYNQHYRPMIEYLVNQAKQQFASYLEKDL
jgi:hypothetical protein